MADQRMNEFAPATEVEYVYAEAADGSQVKIKKNDLIREKQIYRHYKIFCVNAKYGILKRVPYFFIYNFVKCQRK